MRRKVGYVNSFQSTIIKLVLFIVILSWFSFVLFQLISWNETYEVKNDSVVVDSFNPSQLYELEQKVWPEYWKLPFYENAKFELLDEISTKMMKTKENRYVTFEDDAGGWNNIRICFEVFVLFAKLSNRILGTNKTNNKKIIIH